MARAARGATRAALVVGREALKLSRRECDFAPARDPGPEGDRGLDPDGGSTLDPAPALLESGLVRLKDLLPPHGSPPLGLGLGLPLSRTDLDPDVALEFFQGTLQRLQRLYRWVVSPPPDRAAKSGDGAEHATDIPDTEQPPLAPDIHQAYQAAEIDPPEAGQQAAVHQTGTDCPRSMGTLQPLPTATAATPKTSTTSRQKRRKKQLQRLVEEALARRTVTPRPLEPAAKAGKELKVALTLRCSPFSPTTGADSPVPQPAEIKTSVVPEAAPGDSPPARGGTTTATMPTAPTQRISRETLGDASASGDESASQGSTTSLTATGHGQGLEVARGEDSPAYQASTPSWWHSGEEEAQPSATSPASPGSVDSLDSDKIERELVAKGLMPPLGDKPVDPGAGPQGPPPPVPVAYSPNRLGITQDTEVVTWTGPVAVLPLTLASSEKTEVASWGSASLHVSSRIKPQSAAPSRDIDSRPRLRAQQSGTHGSAHPRIRVATYNAGGLSTPAYHELLQWLRRMPDDIRPAIVHIQESHWPSDSEYSTPGWHIIASSTPSPAAGGVLTMVSDELCNTTQLTHTAPIPGRVLHTRISLSSCTIDSVNVYQKIFAAGAGRKELHQDLAPREQRLQVWSTLGAILRATPMRNLLFLAGDFNTALVVDHNLVMLNSWTRHAVASFVSPTGNSLIDHIYVRRFQADPMARNAAPLAWPLASWKQGGLQIPTGRAHHSATRVEASIEDLNLHMREQVCGLFAARKQNGILVPWQREEVSLSVKGMWAAYARWRRGTGSSVGALFRTWQAHAQFRKAHREFRMRSRQARKAWFLDQVVAMESAAHYGDVRALFQLSSFLAPKQPRRKLQLRGPQGELWTNSQQVRALTDFYLDVYAPEDEPPLQDDVHLTHLFQAPDMSQQEWEARLALLPPNKAAPKHLAPSAAFVACSDILSGFLWNSVDKCLTFIAGLGTGCNKVQVLNAFADDLHVGQIVYTSELGQIRSLDLHSGLARLWKRRCYVQDKEGLRLRIRTPGERVFTIPIVDKHPYLGVVIAYGGAAKLTVQHRTQLAWAAWTRLRPLLTGAQAPALELRLRLWRACIPPILLYGLDCMPLSGKLLHEVQRLLTRQLRAVARSQAHITHETTAALHARLRVPFAADILSRAVGRVLTRASTEPSKATPGYSPSTLINEAWLRETLDFLRCGSAPAPGPSSQPADSFTPGNPLDGGDLHQCRECGYLATSFRLLRVHLSVVHGHKASHRFDANRFCRSTHSTQGMPTCRLCGRAFPRWTSLRTHMQDSAQGLILRDPPLDLCHQDPRTAGASRMRHPCFCTKKASTVSDDRAGAAPDEVPASRIHQSHSPPSPCSGPRAKAAPAPMTVTASTPVDQDALRPSTSTTLDQALPLVDTGCEELPLPPPMPLNVPSGLDSEAPLVTDMEFCSRLRQEGWQALLHDGNIRQSHLLSLFLMTMDTDVQDPKELQVFAAFLTNENGQTPAPAPPSGEPGAQPKRRRESENPPEGTSLGSGSAASAPGIYLSMPQGSGNHPKGKGKNKGKGKGGKGKGQPPPRHQQGDWSSSSSEWSQGWNQGWGSNSGRYQGDLVTQISKLLLRHELQLQNLQGDTKLHLYLRTGAQSFLPSLFAIAREWGKLYREEPAKLGMSLRETLLVALLREMATRAKLAMNRADSKQAALDLKWINSHNQWSYMQWNPHTAQLDLLEEPAPRDHSEILQGIDH
ncbi:unnamed protein product, partial [Symbiodinium sp. CCMP2592]